MINGRSEEDTSDSAYEVRERIKVNDAAAETEIVAVQVVELDLLRATLQRAKTVN